MKQIFWLRPEIVKEIGDYNLIILILVNLMVENGLLLLSVLIWGWDIPRHRVRLGRFIDKIIT